MRVAMLVSIASAIALCPSSATAQEVGGAWAVRWASDVRVRGAQLERINRWGEAALVLVQEGEDLSGTWRSTAGDRATWQLHGSIRDGVLRLSATEHDSDHPDLQMVESIEFEAELADGRLEGEMWIVIPKIARDPVRRPWSAERADGG